MTTPTPRAVVSADAEVGDAFRTALRDTAPLALPLIPFALAIGSATASEGLPLLAGFFGGALLLAGASQLALTEVLGAGGTLAAAATVAAVVNLRFAIYSVGLAHWFAGERRSRVLLMAAALVDQTFLLCDQAFASRPEPAWRRRYYQGVTVVLAGTFLAFQPVGYLVGDVLPASLGLHVGAPLAFAGLLGSALKTRRTVVAAATAAVVVVAASGTPAGLGLVIAGIAGVAAGSSIGGER